MADTDVFGDTTEKMSTEDITTEETADAPKEDITEVEETQPEKIVKEELLKVETEDLSPDSVVKETVDENGDVFEETTAVTRKVVKRTMKITETSSTTKTTTMTTPAKLYGKDLSEYDEVDVDALLAQLSPEEINILAKEVDPDDNFLPPNQRCSYECTKDPTGPLNRKKLIEHINKEALETPDLPEIEPFVKGTVRGKKWVPPPRDEREIAADEQIAIDMGEEYEHALSDATQEEIIDLAAILGFHSMMNQDQYHASLLNKGQPVGLGWDGITKSTTQKLYPMDPPNNTDVEESIKRVKDDDPKLIELNLNNIKNISDEKFEQLFDALPQNEHLEVLSLTNVGLTDKTALLLAEAIEKSKTLRVLNVETNFINPPVIVTLVKALLKARTIEEFRASNQRSTVLGNKIEMEITDLVEKNTSLLRLGLHLEFNDARHRVAAHLQRNIDRNEHELRKGTSSSPIPNATSANKSAAGTVDDLSSMLSLQKANRAKSPKPMHTVLTPKDRIDSKSELIAALASQKLSDRGRGEISLAVPQTQPKALSRSPPNDRVNSAKDRRSPVKEKEVSPKTVEVEVKPLEVKDAKSPSPSRNPKIGELRHSMLSKAVDEESISKQESDDSAREPMPIAENGEAVNDLLKKPAELNIQEVAPQVETPQIKVSLDTSVDDEDQKTPSTIPERQTEKEQLSTPDLPGDELAADRASVSPSRNLEDRMAVLRAKIDSFAEIADEKLSSIRSKFDDLARDTILDQTVEPPRKPRENGKPVPVKVDEPDKPIDIVPQIVDPCTLPPIAPQASDRVPKTRKAVPSRPLVRTPNSVGITFLYQRQYIVKPETVTASENLEKIVEAPQSEPKKLLPESPSEVKGKTTEVIEPLPSEIKNTLPDITDSSKEPMTTTDLGTAESVENLGKPVESPQSVSSPITNIADQSTESAKLVSNPTSDSTGATIEPLPPTSKLTEKITNRSPGQVSEVQNTPPEVEKPTDTTVNSIQEKKSQQIAKAGSETTALSLLSIKKAETLKIDPIKMVEAATQSPSKPSPLTRLSFRKVDTQKIDPPKAVDVGTQSPGKPDPMKRLSIKRADIVDIVPIAKSEVSTQFVYKEPIAEASSQTIEDEPIETIEEATQTPLVFSSLEHDYIFPGLRRVPHLPRPKTINIGGGDRVIVKPSSKPINEVLMVLYPAFHNYSNAKPQADESSTKSFGLEEDIIKTGQTENTIKDLEEAMLKATTASDSIVNSPQKSSVDAEEANTSIKTEVEIPLVGETPTDSIDSSMDDPTVTSTATRFETKFTAVEKVSGLSRTTISSEAHVEVIDKAFKSVAKVSASEGEHITKTSIRSANMWESLSSNLIKASEQTLLDISKSAEMGKVGKVSVYSSVEDLSHSSRSKYTDRHIGGLIKTVEKTTVYSSTEDIPITAYTRYSDRYNDDKTKGKVSVYSSTEDLEQSSYTKYSDRYASDLLQSAGKRSVYSSTEDLPEVPYTKYSDRYSDTKEKVSHFSVDTPLPDYKSMEEFLPLPRSKFADRYNAKSLDTHRSQPKFPVSQTSSKSSRSYYKSAALDDFSASRSQYKTSEDLSHRTSVPDRGTHKYAKSHDYSLQSAIMSSITHNESALRPYTYVPTSIYTDLAIDHVPSRPTSPAVKHTSTLQLNISPSGIRESTPRRYINKKDTIDKPKIVVSRPKDEKRSTIRAYSPIERSHASSNLLSPYRKVSDRANDDDSIDESSQSKLDISSASAATAEYNASTTKISTDTPKKRANIMDTIKMLKNRVRDVITTEDRFSETHRLPSSSSSSASVTSRAARTFATTTSSSLNIPHDNDEKEI